jgi:bacterioferritin-associated ferredoxin
MIVCLCKGVSCKTVRASIAQGAASVEEIGAACGAGTDCGGCEGALENILEEELGPAGLAAAGGRRSLPVIRAA